METPYPKLYDWQVLQNIAPYLNLSDLIKTATLSKEYNYSLRNYFRKHILPKNVLTGGNTNELTLAKKLLHRQIRILKLEDNTETTSCPNSIAKSLQVGVYYSLIETYQGEKIILSNNELTDKNNQLKVYHNLTKKYHGKHIHLVGEFLYIGQDNKLTKISFKQKQSQTNFFHEEDALHFEAQISQIKSSQTHLFVITVNTFHENKLFAISYKTFKSVEVHYQSEAGEKNLNVSNLSVGANTAYYISKFKVFELDVENSKEPKMNKSLKDKNIRRIINGAKHFFAVEKMGKITEQWDNPDVIAWAQKEGFEDYVQIFKSQKVTGKTLITMDRKYMEDVLGLLSDKLQQRLKVQIEQNNIQTEQNCTIWAWGRNDKAQLGLNPSNPISNPYKIKLPQGYNFLLCHNNITLLHNKKTGKIAINSVNQDGKADWKIIYEKIYNIWSISVNKDLIMVLCPVEKQYISQHLSEVPVHHKKEKLRTAKNIIDKITWDQNLNKEDFTVGYLDKYTGILQITFENFLKNPEIRDYRIEYFKRNGELVWSKKDRIDIL